MKEIFLKGLLGTFIIQFSFSLQSFDLYDFVELIKLSYLQEFLKKLTCLSNLGLKSPVSSLL